MRELILMVRGSDSMNVPSERVQAYLDEGWREVSRTPLEPVPAETAPVATETPVADAAPAPAAPAPVATETPVAEAASAPADKPKGKGK